MRFSKSIRAGLALLVLLTVGVVGAARETEQAPAALAVIVNEKNPTTELKLSKLRAYFKLDKTFWSNKSRVKLYLRPTSSTETEILLDRVYRMSSTELRKHWRGKVFRGEISSEPDTVPSAKAAGARVRAQVGAITAVLANEVPEGVRVLAIDGKLPGEEGYPLVADSDRTFGGGR